MVQVTWSAVQSPESSKESREVLKRVLPLLMAALLSDEELLLFFYQFESLKVLFLLLLLLLLLPFLASLVAFRVRPTGRQEWLRACLLETPDPAIRAETANGIAYLCAEARPGRSLPRVVVRCVTYGRPQIAKQDLKASKLSAPPHTFFLQLLLSFLPQAEEHARTCEEYFGLLERLLREQRRSPRRDAGQYRRLLADLLAQLQRHGGREETAWVVGREDKVLVGMLRLLRRLLREDAASGDGTLKDEAEARGLLEEVFHACLFARPSREDPHARVPKCRSRPARLAAFGLLLEAVRDHPRNHRRLLRHIQDQLDGLHLRGEWTLAPLEKEKSIFGYVGLQNMVLLLLLLLPLPLPPP
jgi:hypothetical protein